ncbi:MAG: tetratricopeptide repeat protein [Planctomycetota bacterium]
MLRASSARRALLALALTPILAAAQKPGLVGTRAARLSLRGLAGETVQLPGAAHGGPGLGVLVFWSTWARHSARELGRLGTLWPRWSENGIRVVAINVEAAHIGPAETAAVEKWLEARKLMFPVAIDDGLKAYGAYGVGAVPTTIVVDATGTIVMRLPGFPVGGSEQLFEFIEKRVATEQAALAEDPSRPPSIGARKAVRHVRLARFLMQRGKHDMARYTLEQAILEDPGLVDAWIGLARLELALGKGQEAAETLARAAARFPDSPVLQLERARHLLQSGRNPEAEALARQALAGNPSLAPAFTLLGRIRLARNDLGSAVKAFRDAIAANPLDPDPLIELARVHRQRGEMERAVAELERAYSLLVTRVSARQR